MPSDSYKNNSYFKKCVWKDREIVQIITIQACVAIIGFIINSDDGIDSNRMA
jgi:hypothetical protein